MWINPKFKYDVIKFVYDQLIQLRHEAGDNFLMLSAAVAKLQNRPSNCYTEVSIAMQWIVFNKTGKNLRQFATQEQLKEIKEIEQKLAFAIDMGYIKTYNNLIKEMRKLYAVKYNKF